MTPPHFIHDISFFLFSFPYVEVVVLIPGFMKGDRGSDTLIWYLSSRNLNKFKGYPPLSMKLCNGVVYFTFIK